MNLIFIIFNEKLSIMLRKFLAVASLIFVFNQSVYSQDIIKIDDFIIEHSGFEENEVGEITPINIKEINKKT